MLYQILTGHMHEELVPEVIVLVGKITKNYSVFIEYELVIFSSFLKISCQLKLMLTTNKPSTKLNQSHIQFEHQVQAQHPSSPKTVKSLEENKSNSKLSRNFPNMHV
ncbi:hypothetical protein CIPAW_09G156500 [Carya illinoinensis]|uniref:Uncharacterized protein n=1 Tax=Carya illinoinensis TaxID=32201 RepID=A0A8T1PLD7_CARIL|nr:hypothetical protein CIPAW_09G156500 [Carya illinoinensis]